MSNSQISQTRQQKLSAIAQKYQSRFKIQHITPKQVVELQNSSTTIIFVDVRTKQEISVSTIPNAISKEEFLQSYDPKSIQNEDVQKTKVVAYCTVGFRSSQFVEQLLKDSADMDVANLSGGVLQWTSDQLPLVQKIDLESDTLGGNNNSVESSKDSKQKYVPTKKVHVFNKDFELQGEGYDPVVFKRPLLSLARDMMISKLKPFLKW